MDSNKKEGAPSWITIIRRYNQPDTRKSIWQIINSLGPYLILWAVMYYTLGISYWITLGISLLAAGFLVRIFIIFHDLGHGSFFKSSRTSRIVGTLMGCLVFTPYDRWHRSHAAHHSTVGNLDKRGEGDVWTLTADEYRSKTRGQQLFYRLYRNPIMLFLLGPVILFTIWFRFNTKGATRKERLNTNLVNLIILAWALGLSLLLGWKAFLMIQIPVIFFATSAGSWLFYVQHQFEDVIWSHNDQWDYQEMALRGSSFLKMPRIIQWFSGNIGFHHIHHLSPKIPNYNLPRCHQENQIFSSVKPITIGKGLQTMKFRLWDENMGRLISFGFFKRSSAT